MSKIEKISTRFKHEKNNTRFGILTLTLGIVGVSAGAALAYQGDHDVKGPNYSEERHEAMEEAFENNDYGAWANLMHGKGKVAQVINEDNFPEFAEAYELMEEGKTAEAEVIRQELGLGQKNGSMKGMHKAGMHRGMNNR